MSPGARLARLVLPWGRILPPRFAWWLGGVAGHAFALIARRDPGRCAAHLRLAFPDRRPTWIAATTRRCFRHFGRMAAWTLATYHHPPTRLRRIMAIEGADNLAAVIHASQRGEGTVMLSGHLGNWEVLARVCGTMFPVTVVGRRMRDPDLDRIVQELRTGTGNQAIYQEAGLGPCVRAVRAGRAMATLPDQDIGRLQGCFVPWFGIPAYTPIGAAAIARLTDSPVQMGFCFARGGRWVMHFSPRRHFASGDRNADMLAIMTWAMAYQERLVRRVPEQWGWWHKRWRTRPEQRPEALGAQRYLTTSPDLGEPPNARL